MQFTRYTCQNLREIEIHQQIWKNYQISNVMIMRPLGYEFFHAYGQTDR